MDTKSGFSRKNYCASCDIRLDKVKKTIKVKEEMIRNINQFRAENQISLERNISTNDEICNLCYKKVRKAQTSRTGQPSQIAYAEQVTHDETDIQLRHSFQQASILELPLHYLYSAASNSGYSTSSSASNESHFLNPYLHLNLSRQYLKSPNQVL